MSIENKILNFLEENKQGAMFIEIADAIGVHRHTATKYVYKLIGEGKIKVRKVGIAKLCYLNKEGENEN